MRHIYAAGWEAFSPDPGKEEVMHCRVCKEKMTVERNVNGPRTSIEGMSGFKSLFDRFTCPNSGQDWHNQVLALKIEQSGTPSKKLYDIFEEEINGILFQRNPTVRKFLQNDSQPSEA